jgi:CopG family transcriptional regulator/antitoxin EndoAI
MKKTNFRRINVSLPESTIAVLEHISDKGERSMFIDEAIKERAARLKKKNLRELLKEGALVHQERDLDIAREWFHLEEELWKD